MLALFYYEPQYANSQYLGETIWIGRLRLSIVPFFFGSFDSEISDLKKKIHTNLQA